jgi:hypothetical protein
MNGVAIDSGTQRRGEEGYPSQNETRHDLETKERSDPRSKWVVGMVKFEHSWNDRYRLLEGCKTTDDHLRQLIDRNETGSDHQRASGQNLPHTVFAGSRRSRSPTAARHCDSYEVGVHQGPSGHADQGIRKLHRLD